MQNGYVESRKGRVRDELLNETLFRGLDHARVVIREEWSITSRPNPRSDSDPGQLSGKDYCNGVRHA